MVDEQAVRLVSADVEFVGGRFVLKVFDARQRGLDFAFAERAKAGEERNPRDMTDFAILIDHGAGGDFDGVV